MNAKKSSTGSIQDLSKLSLSNLSLDYLGETLGGTRTLYNNGTMTGVFYLSYQYSLASGDDPTTKADIEEYLKTSGNVIFCIPGTEDDSTDPPTAPTPITWTITTDDNGYWHDVIVPIPQPSTVTQGSSAPGVINGWLAFFILPDENFDSTIYIGCYLSPYKNGGVVPSNSPPQLSCVKLSVDTSKYELIDHDVSSGEPFVRELRCTTALSAGALTPEYAAPSDKTHPDINSYTEDDPQNTPFKLSDSLSYGYFFLVYQGTNNGYGSGRTVYLLNKNENLGKNMEDIFQHRIDTREPYYANNDDPRSWSVYPNNVKNNTWDSSEVTGLLIGSAPFDMFVNEESDPIRVQNYHSSDGTYFYPVMIDTFGNVIEFKLHMNPKDDNFYTWDYISAALK
jgi:hypothetical protein